MKNVRVISEQDGSEKNNTDHTRSIVHSKHMWPIVAA